MKTKFLAILLLAVAIGCSHNKAKPAASAAGRKSWFSKRENKKPDDASFAAGAGRAPSATTTYSFAKILVAQGRDRDALYVLGKLLRDHPNFVPAYNEVAGIYVRSDRLSDALTYLNAGLKHSPKDAVLHNNIGMVHFLADRHAEALTAFTAAVEEAPTVPTYRANRAAALAMLGLTDEAESDYRTVLNRHDTRVNLQALAKARHQHDTSTGAQPSETAEQHPQQVQPAANEKAQTPEPEEKTKPAPVSLQAPKSVGATSTAPANAADIPRVAFDDTEEGDQETATP